MSGKACSKPEAFFLMLPSLGGDEGRLLKDAKAEAGLQPVWNEVEEIVYRGDSLQISELASQG